MDSMLTRDTHPASNSVPPISVAAAAFLILNRFAQIKCISFDLEQLTRNITSCKLAHFS